MATGYTDHDRALTVDGTTFEPETGFSASEARETLGLAVDTVDVEGALSSERHQRRGYRRRPLRRREGRDLSGQLAQAGRFRAAAHGHHRQDHAQRPAFRRRTGKPGPHAGPAERPLCEPRLRRGTRRCTLQVRCSTSRDFREAARSTSSRLPTRSWCPGLERLSSRLVFLRNASLGDRRARRADASGSSITGWTGRRRVLGAPAAGRTGHRAGRQSSIVLAGCDKTFATCRGEVRQCTQFSRLSASAGQRRRLCLCRRRRRVRRRSGSAMMECERSELDGCRCGGPRGAALDRHALPASGRTQGRRLRLPRPGARRLARASMARARASPAPMRRIGPRRAGRRPVAAAARRHLRRKAVSAARRRRSAAVSLAAASAGQACRHPDRARPLHPCLSGRGGDGLRAGAAMAATASRPFSPFRTSHR